MVVLLVSFLWFDHNHLLVFWLVYIGWRFVLLVSWLVYSCIFVLLFSRWFVQYDRLIS